MSDSHLLNTNNIVNLDTYLASNYVTQDTAQTITGAKAFTTGLIIKNSSVPSSGTAPASEQHRYIFASAQDGTYTSLIDFSKNTGNYSGTGVYARCGSYTKGIAVFVGPDGTTVASAPTPTDTTSTSSTQIATTGWCNTNLSRTDLSNSPYTTNRILKIPQDIKVDITGNNLYIRAGTVLYKPNGFESDGTTRKFTSIITSSDIVVGAPTANTMWGQIWTDGSTWGGLISKIYSGSTAPSGTGYMVWYDTTNNLLKMSTNGGSTWTTEIYFPICYAHRTVAVGFDLIKEVYNGSGYIGSTVFVLPGVKGEIPNGRNEDGTYISAIKTIPTVRTLTFPANYVSPAALVLQEDTYLGSYQYGNTIYFDSEKGRLIRGSDNTDLIGKTVVALFDVDNTGKILSMYPKSVDSVANSNMSNISSAGRSFISGMGMPSSKYEDWTLGASGSTYTAPANGYLTLFKFASGGSAQYAQIRVGYLKSDFRNVPSGQQATPMLPLLKGETATVDYNLTGTTQYFRFIYAEGEI